MNNLPVSIFVSHGSPGLSVEPCPAREFLMNLGGSLRSYRAVVCVSAHWATAIPTVTAAEEPETIHDFYGFSEDLYRLRYRVPGSAVLATEIASALKTAGMDCRIDRKRGLDHGAWVPLSLMFPDGEIPALQVSVQPQLGPAHHFKLGMALGKLGRKDVLIMGSGSATHNLEFMNPRTDAPPPVWVTEFNDWLTSAIISGRSDSLLNYRRAAPYAVRNHPTEEHFLPLIVAAGVAGMDFCGWPLHSSYTYATLSMASFAFAPRG